MRSDELAEANAAIANTGWQFIDDETIESCCGIVVEWDAEECPECGAVNPLTNDGWI